MDIFKFRNLKLENNKMQLIVNGIPNYIDFPYNTYSDMLEIIKAMNPTKIGTNDDIDENFERGYQTFPFSLAFDYFVFTHKNLPSYTDLINQYIDLCFIRNNNNTLTQHNWLGQPFTITYNALCVRVYKVYFSFIREYSAFLYLYENLKDVEGVTVFMNREDDYKGRIDIGVKYKDTLYIIDTSLKSNRSNDFEILKTNGTRRNMSTADQVLVNKYGCDKYCRILAKAVTWGDDSNTYKCGQAYLYNTSFLDNIVSFIKTNDIYNIDVNASSLN